MRALSLSPLTVLPCSPLDQIDAALDAGFARVGLRLFPTLPTDVDVMSDPHLQRAVERRIAQTGVEVLDIEVVRVTPDMDMAPIERALGYAASLGARWLAATSLGVDEYSPSQEPDIVRRLAELGQVADRHGMGVMLEFMAFRGLRTIEDATRVVAAVQSPNVAITIDALHFFRSGGEVEKVEKLDPALFACLQLCDGPANAPADLVREARQDRKFPGEGELPLERLVSALPPDLPVSVEVPSAALNHLPATERAQQAARWTRELIARSTCA